MLDRIILALLIETFPGKLDQRLMLIGLGRHGATSLQGSRHDFLDAFGLESFSRKLTAP